MKIAITGATGLIGWTLAPYLTSRGHKVVCLSRSGGTGTVRWDPDRREIEPSVLRGLDAVIHLAGENLAEGRWTLERKHRLMTSRVEPTRWLVDLLGTQAERPRVFVSASAIGYYGDTGETLVDETAPAGTGFLADLCRAWETEAWRAESWGARVVALRTSPVLTPAGGALAKMLPVFRLGLGGRIATGRQWMSWIALDDVLGAVVHVLETETLRGPVNLVSPEPVRNDAFTETLARVLRRPAIISVPPRALRLAFGEMADEALLLSSRVRPTRLLDSGYAFRWPHLEEALRHLLAK